MQFVALRLVRPCFKASNLFFQIVFKLQQRRILLKQRELRGLSLGKDGLQGCDFCERLRINLEFKQHLDDLVRLAERRRGGDYVHVVFPNVRVEGLTACGQSQPAKQATRTKC